jgi:hypothetical protein
MRWERERERYRKVARRRVYCIGGRWQIWREWITVEGRWVQKSGTTEGILYRG